MIAPHWFIVLACVFVSASASAQSPLRWKLAAGDELTLEVQQATTSDVAFSGKRAVTQIDLTIGLTWKVLAAENQEYRIQQSIDHLQMKLAPEKGQAVIYDSRDNKRLTGAAKDLQAGLQPLVGAAVEIAMTDRGAITAVKPANEAAESLFAESPPAGQPALSRSTVQQLLKQSLVVLPEGEVGSGDSWESSAVLASALGSFQQVTTYKLADAAEEGGQQRTKIESTTRLQPTAPGARAAQAPAAGGGAKAAALPTIKSHEQSGAILFDAAAGRVVEAESTQTLVTERPFRETTIVVKLESKQRTTVNAAEADTKASDEN